jgi:hypothetical protein
VHLFTTLAIVCVSAAVITLSAVSFLRWMGLHWSCTAPGVLAGALLLPFDQQAAGFVVATSAFATATGARWHADDLRRGGDQAQNARDRRTMLDAHRERRGRRRVRGGRWIDRHGLAVGTDRRGRTVRIPAGGQSGRHTLVVGATGSGKTVTQAWIAGRLIRAGHGAVVIDPKGDALLREELEFAARRQRRTFRLWTPERSTTRSRTAPTPSWPTRSWPARATPNRTTCARRSAISGTRCARSRAHGCRSRSRR